VRDRGKLHDHHVFAPPLRFLTKAARIVCILGIEDRDISREETQGALTVSNGTDFKYCLRNRPLEDVNQNLCQ